jgi:hypothetical protein
MITYKQITKASAIAALSDYYVLDVRTTGPNPAVNAISSVSMLQIENDFVVQEAVVRIASVSGDEAVTESGYYQPEQVAASISRILTDQVVIAEPNALQFLRVLLERFGHEGEIRFVPIGLLVRTIFSEAGADSIPELARQLEIPERSDAGLLRTACFEHALFRKCREELGVSLPDDPDPSVGIAAEKAAPAKKRRISSRTLKRWARNVWSVSPWVVVGVAFLFVLFVVIHLPRKESTEVDRNTPVVNYLVLSWDEPGKYGTRTRARGNEEPVIEFRVPYGVYDILNNNSIPVELTIGTDKTAASKASPSPEASPETSPTASPDVSPAASPDASLAASPNASPVVSPEASLEASADGSPAPADSASDAGAVAAELSSSASVGPADAEEEEEDGPVKITMRPNSKRTITIDTDQYLTLSENANDLILFYVSEVPEEKESDVTGRDGGDSGRVVYAYVKGTEVRFRKSPSLEGAIIDSMQNGQQVQVLGVTGEWTHVAVQNEKGYIFSQFLTSEDPTAAAFEAKKAEEAARQAANAPAVTPSAEPAADSASAEVAPDASVVPDAVPAAD